MGGAVAKAPDATRTSQGEAEAEAGAARTAVVAVGAEVAVTERVTRRAGASSPSPHAALAWSECTSNPSEMQASVTDSCATSAVT